jgi:molybdenum cofactor cytidylyltransferase
VSAVAGILLAAGASTRLGQSKQLLPYRGQSLLRRAAETGLVAGLQPLVIVIGPKPAAMRRELAGLPVEVVENPCYLQGQSTSLRAGLAALPPTVPAAVMLLVDLPGVDDVVVRAVADAWRATGSSIVRPTYQGQPGNPVLFAAQLFPELAATQGDEGGRAVLRAHRDDVYLLPVDSPGILQDVDTWDAYQSLFAAGGAGEQVSRLGRR